MNATELFHADGKTAGIFHCGACRIVARTRAEAEQCCAPRKCACGAECEPHWTACKACRDAADVKREADRFAKAEKVTSFDGPVYSEGHGYQDGYFDSMADFLDWWESDADEGAVRPAYAWACDSSPCCHLDYDQIIEDATQNVHENFDSDSLLGDVELKAALDKFNELNKGEQNWTPDYKLAVLVPAEQPAATGGDRRGGMNLADIQPQMRVAYIPGHAHGDRNHPDVEHGTVSSVNHKFAFVKFDRQLSKFGWNGTTSQSCSPEDLIPL